MIHVIIVDDHSLIRLGIKAALMSNCSDICIMGEAGDGKSLFHLLETTRPDIILLDIFLPDTNGIEIARRLRKEYPEIKILIISGENTVGIIQELLEIEIDGFISKRLCTGEETVEAIRSIMSGMEYFGTDIASIIYKIYISKKDVSKVAIEFTQREKEIIGLCRIGLQSKEIASRINVSSRTVDTHKKNIFKKLGINNTLEMVQYAIKHGIISLQ